MTEYKNVLNVETGEMELVELSQDEIDDIATTKIKIEEERAKIEQEKLQKQSLLDRLGITEEEAKLLLS